MSLPSLAHPGMPILGVETSCDETAVAIVADRRVLGSCIATQIPLHRRFGGVVPEVASRNHLLSILPTIEATLQAAQMTPSELAGIAVTSRPGLIGALLVGVQTARTLALTWGLPVVGVHHIHAHCWAATLRQGPDPDSDPGPALPHLALAVSGGHSSLLRISGPEQVETLGETLDDAAGEALDKFGKLLGLPYPAGPEIDRLAGAGDPHRFQLPRGMRGRSDLAMSFSGLKTAGRQLIDRLRAAGDVPEQGNLIADLCASYQAAVVGQLVQMSRRAARRSGLEQLVIAGGVAANSLLRREMGAMCAEEGLDFRPVPPQLCTDNGAMIAALGGAILASRPGDDPHDLDARATRRQAPKPARRSKPGGRS